MFSFAGTLQYKLGSGYISNASGTEYSSTCYKVKSDFIIRIMREVDERMKKK